MGSMTMARDRIQTRYGFPPEPPSPASLPAAVPWDSEIQQLSGLWIKHGCACGHVGISPLRRMAADHGWRLTLHQVVTRYRCSKCGSKSPEVLVLLDTPTGGAVGAIGLGRGRALDLRGAGQAAK